MIIYNITCKVDWSVHGQWLAWVREEYIPAMLAVELFYHGQLVKLLEIDETDGATYALQFYAQTLDNYRQFMTAKRTAGLRRQPERWGETVMYFGTVMQLVD